MQKTFLAGILLVLLLGISFAEITWQYIANAGITVKPILSGNTAYVASQDGIIQAVSLITGKAVWKKQIGNYILQPIFLQNNIFIANNNGTITRMSKSGAVDWQLNLSQQTSKVTTIFGIGASQSRVYLTTDKGVFSVEGNSVSAFFNSSDANIYTAPAVSGSTIIFGAGDELIAINANKQVIWRTRVAMLWVSSPVVESSMVYIGALDNAIYALDLSDGKIRWRYETNGWITGTPLVQGNLVYAGSDDGYIYAMDSYTGRLKWKAKTEQAVQTSPTIANFAGRVVLLAGSNDGKLYAIEQDTGKILWKFVAGDWVASPIMSNDKIIVGARNGVLYSIKNDRGCTITEPEERTVVGQKEIKIKGVAMSNAGTPGVSIRINNKEWKSARITGDDWELKIDPGEMKVGPNRIYCRITDANGEESEPYYSMIFIKAANIPKSRLIITAPSAVGVGQAFTISVNDADDNSPVEEFRIRHDGKDQAATGNVTLNITTEGRFSATITKTGFEDANVTIDIRASNTLADFALPAVGGLVVLAFIYFFIVRRILRK